MQEWLKVSAEAQQNCFAGIFQHREGELATGEGNSPKPLPVWAAKRRFLTAGSPSPTQKFLQILKATSTHLRKENKSVRGKSLRNRIQSSGGSRSGKTSSFQAGRERRSTGGARPGVPGAAVLSRAASSPQPSARQSHRRSGTRSSPRTAAGSGPARRGGF